MFNLCQTMWTVVVIITVAIGRIPAFEDNNFKSVEEDSFPSTNFVPEKLKISDSIYDHLLVHLGDDLSAENDNITDFTDYFPKGMGLRVRFAFFKFLFFR